MMPKKGPYVAAALLCQEVVEEEGLITIRRVVNEMRFLGTGPNPPDTLDRDHPVMVKLTVLIILYAGEFRGTHQLRVPILRLDGTRLQPAPTSVTFEQASSQITVRIHADFPAEMVGTHWIPIELGDRELTRVPLEIVYQPSRTES